jgi:hypothetical protein
VGAARESRVEEATMIETTGGLAAVATKPRIPLWAKVLYTAFMCVLVPFYWSWYTPWNFLYFCDVALFVTLAGMWLESPFLLSTQAVGLLLPQMLWVADYLAYLVAGIHVTGMTAYMYNTDLHCFVRALSSFHGWLPFLLIWLVLRLGYDRRALRAQAALAVAVLLGSFFLAPAPPPLEAQPSAAVNINYVHGFDDTQAQTMMPPLAWLASLTAVVLVGFLLPTHLLLRRLVPPPASPVR